MTAKHFNAIAAELKWRKPSKTVEPRGYKQRLKQWESDVKGMASICSQFGNNFDQQRFYIACDLEDNDS